MQRYYERVDPGTAARLDRVFEELELDPWSGNVQVVKGEPGTWRRRVGDFRVIYEVDRLARTVTVLLIRPRGGRYINISEGGPELKFPVFAVISGGMLLLVLLFILSSTVGWGWILVAITMVTLAKQIVGRKEKGR